MIIRKCMENNIKTSYLSRYGRALKNRMRIVPAGIHNIVKRVSGSLARAKRFSWYYGEISPWHGHCKTRTAQTAALPAAKDGIGLPRRF